MPFATAHDSGSFYGGWPTESPKLAALGLAGVGLLGGLLVAVACQPAAPNPAAPTLARGSLVRAVTARTSTRPTSTPLSHVWKAARLTPGTRSPDPPATDPAIVELTRQVSEQRLGEDVLALQNFVTRHSLSGDDALGAGQGVGAARAWLHAQFSAIAASTRLPMTVEYDDFELHFADQVTQQRNVIATLNGSDEPGKLIVVGAHYDSRSVDVADYRSPAPGSNDDGSGTAALLELARVLSQVELPATIRLVAFASEEQDMAGSRHYVAEMQAAGVDVHAMLTNDIIGNVTGPEGNVDATHVRVFSADPHDSASRGLARYVEFVGQRYVPLDVLVIPAVDRPRRYGDHVPFNEAGFPAVRLTEALEHLGHQHSPLDLIEHMSIVYLAEVVRLNVAVVASLALAPPPPADLHAARRGLDAVHVAWTPPAQEVAGYLIGMRRADSPAAEHMLWAGDVSEFLLTGIAQGEPVQVWAASVDVAGHVSPFSPEVPLGGD